MQTVFLGTWNQDSHTRVTNETKNFAWTFSLVAGTRVTKYYDIEYR